MTYLATIPTAIRRAAAVIAAASVAGLIATSAAFAASSSGAGLTADTSRAAPAAVRACTAKPHERRAGNGATAAATGPGRPGGAPFSPKAARTAASVSSGTPTR